MTRQKRSREIDGRLVEIIAQVESSPETNRLKLLEPSQPVIVVQPNREKDNSSNRKN